MHSWPICSLYDCIDCDHSSLSRWNRWTQDTRRQAGSGWQEGHGSGRGLQNRSVCLAHTETVFLYVLFKRLWICCTTACAPEWNNKSLHLTVNDWNLTELLQHFRDHCWHSNHLATLKNTTPHKPLQQPNYIQATITVPLANHFKKPSCLILLQVTLMYLLICWLVHLSL